MATDPEAGQGTYSNKVNQIMLHHRSLSNSPLLIFPLLPQFWENLLEEFPILGLLSFPLGTRLDLVHLPQPLLHHLAVSFSHVVVLLFLLSVFLLEVVQQLSLERGVLPFVLVVDGGVARLIVQRPFHFGTQRVEHGVRTLRLLPVFRIIFLKKINKVERTVAPKCFNTLPGFWHVGISSEK